ncbi:hypothetical protein K491DRAFT_695642 [Lophiostoma macrostomum CBS 122681]|uniref:Uncharacterized protein n=1 Tax=Lophiostoma macrostomum CBS 122681 TaxID=1314788 RepID=A0A6A6SXF1_9PLEO|nr:hypothetical protein K491DRAFT_695642 [Lophiostoma macrostomum CBS 122681]
MATEHEKEKEKNGKHNIVFTIPRTASHLLLQILNLDAQPSVQRHEGDGYFFGPALGARFRFGVAGRDFGLWSGEAKDGVRQAVQVSWEKLSEFVEGLEVDHGKGDGDGDSGKRIFVKEHINWTLDPVVETRYLHPESKIPEDARPWVVTTSPASTHTKSARNPTVLPDAFLLNLNPTFLIRNPLLTFPSLLRTSIDNEGLETVLKAAESGAGFNTYRWECTFHWSRLLYEFYTANGVGAPIILDADDLANEDLMKRYAVAVGLDPQALRWEWAKAGEKDVEGLRVFERRMKDTILGSSGIVKEKMGGTKTLALEEEVQRWKKEFGELLAGRLEGLVRDAWRDYEWLKERRFKG